VVWDRPGADRSRIPKSDLVPPFCTFAGECLGSADAVGVTGVMGNGFSCYAMSVEDVKQKMQSSVYHQQVSWQPVKYRPFQEVQ
jgi:hypothetical protein